MRFLHSIVQPDVAIAADGTYVYDLGVNPLSFLLVCLRPLNDTATLANFCSYKTVCEAIDRLTVYRGGGSVVSASGGDLAALNYWRRGVVPMQFAHHNTNNDRRAVVLPVFFGKEPYSGVSCLPAGRRGENTLELTLDIADTGYDGLRLSIEQVEILDAKPKEYERAVVLSQTLAATGQNDIELPPVNKCRGLLVFGTTSVTGATPAPTIGRLATFLDGQQIGFQATDWEVACALAGVYGRALPGFDHHKHLVTTDGNAQTELATLAGVYSVGDSWANHVFLDFDPSRDDAYSVDLSKASQFLLRVEAEAAEAVRVIPVEAVSV